MTSPDIQALLGECFPGPDDENVREDIIDTLCSGLRRFEVDDDDNDDDSFLSYLEDFSESNDKQDMALIRQGGVNKVTDCGDNDDDECCSTATESTVDESESSEASTD